MPNIIVNPPHRRRKPVPTTSSNLHRVHTSLANEASSSGEATSARDRLLTTARRLFYQEGPRAVGIDRVLAESGVAKMSLYRHFRSKDELILACLAEHERDYWKLWEGKVSPAGATAVQQLRNAILFIAQRTSELTYKGCIFLNTAQSFPEATHPAHRAAVEHKQQLAARLCKLCKAAGATSPLTLSRQLVLLINGAQATAGMLGKATQFTIIGAADALLRAQEIEF
ncbi:MAG: TetR/AcrR family transcriptional regulator [Acidobacteriaceae bacterium]|nr:TetR/AcrR family transcriptional regulator [Acidobacteriaceae bacterium]